ncbi:MAG: IS630 family transposase, partial [Thermoanaerobaculia bacterium]
LSPQIINAIQDYVQTHNTNPKPFVWTAKADDILQKVTRARRALDKLPTG